MFFMSLETVIHGAAWDWLGRMFKIKGPTFEKTISQFIKMIAPELYKIFVEHAADSFLMTKLISSEDTLANFPCTRFAVDVAFQLANRSHVSLSNMVLDDQWRAE